MEYHIHRVCLFGFYFSVDYLSAIVWSIWSGVGDWACPISSRMIIMYTASLDMIYRPASSALVADVMICF